MLDKSRGKYAFTAILAVLIAQGCSDGTSSGDSENPCDACTSEQTCVGGVCYDPGDPCSQCKPEQTCNHGVCYDPGDPCSQ